MYVLEPIVVEKPWGVTPHVIKWSTGIGVRRNSLIGELWIASGLKSLQSMSNNVVNAPAGITIADIADLEGEDFLGSELSRSKSHYGKTEAWFVRDVKGDVRTITGLREGMSRSQFTALIQEGFFEEPHSFEELEEKVFATSKFEKNAFYVMFPGTVHAIYAPYGGSYVVIDEIQQGFGDNSLPILSKILFVTESVLSVQVHPSTEDVANETRKDIIRQYSTEPTVRVYDFGRGRLSQPELASELIRYDRKGFIKTTPLTFDLGNKCRVTWLGATRHFARELLELKLGAKCTPHDIGRRYRVIHCVDGEGRMIWDDGEMKISRGMTIAAPAKTKLLSVETRTGLICYRDYVPDIPLLKKYLRSLGASDEEISGVIVEED